MRVLWGGVDGLSRGFLVLDLKEKTRRRARGIMMMNTHIILLMRSLNAMMMVYLGFNVVDAGCLRDRYTGGKMLS